MVSCPRIDWDIRFFNSRTSVRALMASSLKQGFGGKRRDVPKGKNAGTRCFAGGKGEVLWQEEERSVAPGNGFFKGEGDCW